MGPHRAAPYLVAGPAARRQRDRLLHETYFMRGGMEAIFLDLERPTGLLAFAPATEARGRCSRHAAASGCSRARAGTRALRTGALWLKLDQACALHEHHAFIPDLAPSAGPPTHLPLCSLALNASAIKDTSLLGSGARRQCPNRHPTI